ncbi:hypothetical protein HETIRDRAFT_319242 [Heterobasidion irregulare TC 32-1]|uniref:Uncharacterized protein n=1 Tax=Heterobasidion irregulare (strain TC 32-1) TaxID=747525 RepID=W4K4J1_HETIT|nr:uncharacterized protein HETIRDRAFT_319242 [Heterobasidion irregulare TC 32-1]ETW80260.1 hypothetical protein HETIRDRAFT_319242 [Heterobasidion irregulare TC 32-1]
MGPVNMVITRPRLSSLSVLSILFLPTCLVVAELYSYYYPRWHKTELTSAATYCLIQIACQSTSFMLCGNRN